MIVRKAISDLRGFCEEKRRGNAKSAKGLCGLCVRILCDLCVEEEEVVGCLNESRSADGIPRMIDSGEKQTDNSKIKEATGECVATNVIERICKALNCDVGDIMEVAPGKETGAEK